MSDDEELSYIKRQKVIHFGSLEEQEKLKLEQQERQKDEDSDDSKDSSDGEDTEPEKEAMAAGNINTGDGGWNFVVEMERGVFLPQGYFNLYQNVLFF